MYLGLNLILVESSMKSATMFAVFALWTKHQAWCLA